PHRTGQNRTEPRSTAQNCTRCPTCTSQSCCPTRSRHHTSTQPPSTSLNHLVPPSHVLDSTRACPFIALAPEPPPMATSRILAFDPEGRPVDFPGWLRKLKLFLGSRIENDVRLLDHATGKLVAPKEPDPLGSSPTDEEEARFEKLQLAASQWAARDDATVLAITDLLPLTEQQHFEQE
ncbi:unnamed protein product, partial [Closterium sp. NIES-65]